MPCPDERTITYHPLVLKHTQYSYFITNLNKISSLRFTSKKKTVTRFPKEHPASQEDFRSIDFPQDSIREKRAVEVAHERSEHRYPFGEVAVWWNAKSTI
ncbi:hypothetical protein JTE90_029079 [Oedothorax gibbosus]|uniref:Uncharacterized protein n=1 Tax=Oedothorax gibbosus TaxID=931172 RepID=A0AAV6UV26_9ARAC|nr:hypothetical protein JTE90_029079 [Oedothorax gibbosus]